jgi:hypothetical protein
MESNSLLLNEDDVSVANKHDEHLLREGEAESTPIRDLPINVGVKCFNPIWAPRNPQSMGVPVISTPVGCEGLALQSGEHLLVADTPETLALACAVVLRDKKLAFYLARNAHQLVLENYHTSSNLPHARYLL